MKYHEAVSEALCRNGTDRTYACQRNGFGFDYEILVTPDDLFGEENWRRTRHLDTFEVVVAGGAAWILLRGIVVFRPRPIRFKVTEVGVEPPYIWRFNAEDLLDQADGVCGDFAVRLVAGRARSSPWRAHFVDHTGDPGRDVHLERRLGRFSGETLEGAVWAAVRDIRSACPWLPTKA